MSLSGECVLPTYYLPSDGVIIVGPELVQVQLLICGLKEESSFSHYAINLTTDVIAPPMTPHSD